MVMLFHIQMNKIKSVSNDNKTRSAYPEHDILFIRDLQNKKVTKNMSLHAVSWLILFFNYEFFKICVMKNLQWLASLSAITSIFRTRQILINWLLDSLMSDICFLVCNIFRVKCIIYTFNREFGSYNIHIAYKTTGGILAAGFFFYHPKIKY